MTFQDNFSHCCFYRIFLFVYFLNTSSYPFRVLQTSMRKSFHPVKSQTCAKASCSQNVYGLLAEKNKGLFIQCCANKNASCSCYSMFKLISLNEAAQTIQFFLFFFFFHRPTRTEKQNL